VVVAPQCPSNTNWSSDDLRVLVEHLEASYRIDPARVYLTGFSMGGAGTWETAMDHPERFAAIAPVAGRVVPLLAGQIHQMPVWVFHGAADAVVPFVQSEEMVKVLKNVGNAQVRFTAYKDQGHGVEQETYANPALYRWFLRHRLADRP
jgi:predicted peptidase